VRYIKTTRSHFCSTKRPFQRLVCSVMPPRVHPASHRSSSPQDVVFRFPFYEVIYQAQEIMYQPLPVGVTPEHWLLCEQYLLLLNGDN